MALWSGSSGSGWRHFVQDKPGLQLKSVVERLRLRGFKAFGTRPVFDNVYTCPKGRIVGRVTRPATKTRRALLLARKAAAIERATAALCRPATSRGRSTSTGTTSRSTSRGLSVSGQNGWVHFQVPKLTRTALQVGGPASPLRPPSSDTRGSKGRSRQRCGPVGHKWDRPGGALDLLAG